MSNWRTRLMRGLTAFREAFLASDAAHIDDFESLDARRMRYAIYWSMYESNQYRRVHNWSTGMKHVYAVGKYIRSLYNPANRLGNFYAAHLWGGALDPEAGQTGAIPLDCDDPKLQTAIATLWKASNFASLKDIITLRGSIEGDVFLRARDNVNKEVVTLERIEASTLADLTQDALGNVKGYIIEEERPDPTNARREVTYREEVSREGKFCVYQTFKNGKPYAWTEDQPASWSVPYGFVPLVHIQHSSVGLDFGWSELHPMRSKCMECDDLASMLSDQIRKAVNPYWLISGAKEGNLTVAGAQRDETGDTDTRPEPGREELKLIYAPKEAKVEAMVADLDLGDALQHLDSLLKELERDYPELRVDLHATSGTSGRALRVARQSISAKVQQRREAYDAGLAALFKMAVAIGGWRGYKGYEGFNLESYDKGDLDLMIAKRPVFEVDPLDELEISNALWAGAKSAGEVGVPLEGYLKSQGWDDEAIKEIASEEVVLTK